MVLKTVLKVDVSCDKCKREVISIVTDLEGIDKIEADSEKDTLTVIGDADPAAITNRLRKAGKRVQCISVGPLPPKEEKKPNPPDPPKSPNCSCPWSCSCPNGGRVCEPVAIMTMNCQDPAPPPCSIM